MNYWVERAGRCLGLGVLLGATGLGCMEGAIATQPLHPTGELSEGSQVGSEPESATFTLAQVSSADLAEHLRQIGAKMYGAYWCPYCARQEALFGNHFQRIDYVECDPRGENPRPQLCRAANIQGYPTWEIRGQLYPGLQSLEELATLSGFRR